MKKLQQDALLAHLRRHLVQGNLALAIFGDVTPDTARTLAERILKDVPKGPAPLGAVAAAQPQLPARRSAREPREQAIVVMGFPGVAVNDPREDAL
ncbi:MAG: insulinase family protein, partial [Kiritimatiellaeota bacterium]|nr:insulinase family protein [Kiritimatiellota bacterium]